MYFRFDFRLSGLMMGSLLAATLLHIDTVPRLSIWTVPATLVGITAAIAQFHWRDPFILLIGMTCVELMTVFLILAAMQPQKSLLQRLLTLPALVYVRKISYGLYLYHHALFMAMHDQFTWVTVLGVGLPLSSAVAAFSYHTIEVIGRRPRAVERMKVPYADGGAVQSATATAKS